MVLKFVVVDEILASEGASFLSCHVASNLEITKHSNIVLKSLNKVMEKTTPNNKFLRYP